MTLLPGLARLLPNAETMVAAFTVILAISTILLWWETRRLAQGAKDQSADFRRSVEAAERSASAAQKSADVAERALIGLQRPILLLSIMETSDAVPPPGQPAPSHKVQLRVRLENVGLLPAYVETALAEVRAVQRETDMGLKLPCPSLDELAGIHADDMLQHRVVIRPGEERQFVHTGFVDMSEEFLPHFWGLGPRRLIFFGLVTYGDALGIRREMGFTYLYSPLAKTDRWTPFDDRLEQTFDRIIQSDETALAAVTYGSQLGPLPS